MVLCLLALPIFALLGIFSLKYRKLTKDALDCLFRTVTLRKCTSGLDDRIRSDVTGTFLKYSPPLAKLFYKHYKIISWILLILFVWSAWAGGVGVYNYAVHGNCNGASSAAYCVIVDVEQKGANVFDSIANFFKTKILPQKVNESCLNQTSAK